jgi:hypothetical protein
MVALVLVIAAIAAMAATMEAELTAAGPRT